VKNLIFFLHLPFTTLFVLARFNAKLKFACQKQGHAWLAALWPLPIAA
jgi:hypothetical protein